MARAIRRIIRIDEDKCDGCGICAEACHEGAIRIVDGKAKLVSESYCDGLGDCIGPCPRDAISIEERPAEEYDAEAVEKKLFERAACPMSCPGSSPRSIPEAEGSSIDSRASIPPPLSNWPVQLALVPVNAPFLENSDLLITADCVPFALDGFHMRLAEGRVVLTGCPKLDDSAYYLAKLEEIFRSRAVNSVRVVYMEVPCCGALPRLVDAAVRSSGAEVPVESVKIGIRGEILQTRSSS